MVRFSATDNTGRVIVGLGLEPENLTRLQAGQPIALKLDELHPGLVADLVIFFGKDRYAIMDDLAATIGPETKLNPPFTPAKEM